MRAADPFTGTPAIERGRGGFMRSTADGAPWVAHPTKTAKHTGNKADLLALCKERGITVPDKATVADLHDLLGSRPARVKYGSTSSFGGMIEDPYALAKYTERYIVEGIGIDVELQAMCATLAHMGREHPEFTALADSIVARARDTANHMLLADRGTHMHAVTDDIDLGRDWRPRIPEGEALGIPAAAQISLAAAWVEMIATYGIEVLAVEASCVDDEWHLAGTLDRIVRLRKPLRFVMETGEIIEMPAGTVRIGDTKTGHPRRRKHAIQLASYRKSKPYDTVAETRGEWPWHIEEDYGLIFHLDVTGALEGRPACTLVLVDLVAGRLEGGATVVAAKAWANRRNIFSTGHLEADPIVTAGGPPLPAVTPAVTSAPTPAPVPPRAAPVPNPSVTMMAAPGADVTPPATPGLPLPVETQQAGAVPPSTAPAEHSPLRAAQLTRQRQLAQADANRRLHGTPDEGADSDERTFRVLRRHYDDLTDPQRSWIAALGREAEEAGVGFSSKTAKTVRRFEVLRALVFLAARDETDTQVRQWLTLVDRRIEQLDTVPLGHIVGSLHAHEAATFAKLVTDELRPVINDDGTTTLAPAAA